MNLYGFSNLVGTIANLGIAFLVYFKGRGSKMSRIWAVFTLCVAIYCFGAYMASGSKDKDSAFIWWQFSYVGVIMLPVLFMHFVYVFLEIKRSWMLKGVYAFTAFIWVSNIFSRDLFIGNVERLFTDSRWFSPAWWVYSPGPLHVAYVLLLYIGLLAFLLVKLIRAYSRVGGTKRKQIGYFFSAMALGFIGGGTSFLPCFGVNIYPVLNITVPLYTFIIAYAIIRHNLMDIEVIVRKTIVFAVLFVVAYGVFASFAYLGSGFFENMVRNRWIAVMPSILVIVIILRPLENFLRDVTDKYLFQKKYDYRQLLRTFSDEVLAVLDLQKLVDLTVNKLAEIMRLESASIFLSGKDEDRSMTVASVNGMDPAHMVPEGEDIITYMQKRGGHVLKPAISGRGIREAGLNVEAESINSNLIVPLMHNSAMEGVLILGKKKSDESFTRDDIDILLTLAKTLAIAITNARLFEQLSQAQAQAAQREKMAVIGTLSAGINHEICNPLGISRGQCEMFLLNLEEGVYEGKSGEELLDKAKEIMRKVINETDRATLITRKLSAFAKPAGGKTESDIRIIEELEEVISLVRHDLRLDNISIMRDFQQEIPPIEADRKQVQEIFFNIIRNAAQAIKTDGTIRLKVLSVGDKVRVRVEDSGSGMDKGIVKKIFDPFFTTKDPGKGTGLGLFIVKQIVERNKGSITVESEAGRGSVFTVEFPAAEAVRVTEK